MNEITNQQFSATAIATTDKQAGKLILIKYLLQQFEEESIDYCHWKSNEHLYASMTGDTDLDILFDNKQKGTLEILLDKLGFKKFISISQKQYNDIEDFIGLDFSSGKVVHLHAHFKLTMGEAYLKSYQLNLEEKILNTRVFDETFGIYRIDPAFELILLYFREALKTRNRDVLKMYLQHDLYFKANIVREYTWLTERCTPHEILTILENTFANYQPLYEYVTGKFNKREVFKLAALVNKEFTNRRLFSPLKALRLRWYREISVQIFRKLSKVLNRPILSKRINPRGGLVIAVIGADGSGKSTVVANLEATFSKKIDVYSIYFGRGVGKISWPRKLLLAVKNLGERKHFKINNLKLAQHGSPKKNGFKANVYKCIEALIVANEKCRNLKLMQAAKKKGMLIICDRFPQSQIVGYNDGPLLGYLSHSPSPVFRAVSKMEARMYALTEKNPPDVVFKLIADAHLIEARKPGETALPVLMKKIAGIKQINFPEACKVITVDASQSLEDVLFTIKNEIWNVYP